MYSRYLIIISLLFLLCLPALATSYFYLRNSGEIQSMEEMAIQQARSSEFCLVGPALDENLYQYKVALYRELKPDVVALGSSRVLQFRAQFFRERFLNMGNSLGKLANAEPLLKDMLAVHKPKMVILGIDYWWFNDLVEDPAEIKVVDNAPFKLGIGQLLLPFKWLKSGKIDRRQFLARANPGYQARGPCRIGVSAHEATKGFGPDGSYYYTDTITGSRSSARDRHFANTLKRVRNSVDFFQQTPEAHPALVQKLKIFGESLQAAGTSLVMYMPPNAPTVAKEIANQKDNAAYMHDLREKLRSAGLVFHDFHQPAVLNAVDCEFVDGFHSGDVTHARILDAIIQSGNQELETVANIERIKTTIGSFAGRAMLPDQRITGLPEVDFLDIGCNKH